jgi:hypothetical protein
MRWGHYVLRGFRVRRTGWPIDFIFLRHSGVGWGRGLLISGAIRSSIWPPGGHLGFPIPRTVTAERVTQFISYFSGIAGWVGGCTPSISGTIRYSIWPPGRHLGFCILQNGSPNLFHISVAYRGHLGCRIPDCNCRTGPRLISYFCDKAGLWEVPINFGCPKK